VPETRGREGDILLLEEDHMPTPDLLETMKRLLSIKNSGDCPGCWGAYSKFGCERQEQETDVHKASSRLSPSILATLLSWREKKRWMDR